MDGFLELGLGLFTLLTAFAAMIVVTLRANERRFRWKPATALFMLTLACFGAVSLIDILRLPSDIAYWPALPLVIGFIFLSAAIGSLAGTIVAFPIRLWLDKL